MKNKIKYFVLYPLMLLIVILTFTYDVKELISLGQRIPFGSSYWKDSLSDAISTNKSIKLGTGDSLYYNGVVVTSGSSSGIAASDNITFTGRDSTTDLWRFGDSVRFYDHVLFKDTLKVSNAIAIFDSAKISVDVSMLSDSSGINWTSGGLSQIYQLPSPASILAFKQNEFDFFTKKGNQILYLDSLNGMTLNYGVYTGNGSGLTSVDAITLKGQDTSKFARTDTLITEDIKGKWNFWNVVSFITIPTIPSFFQNAGRTIQYFLPNSASDTLLTRGQTQTITNKTISGSSNTITGIKSGMTLISPVVLTPVPDATTYYFGGNNTLTPTSVEGQRRIYMPIACTIKAVIISTYIVGTPTNEAVSLYIRKNSTTDSVISTSGTWGTSTDYNVISKYNMGVVFAAGDYFEFKLVTPTWVTNPTSAYINATFYFE